MTDAVEEGEMRSRMERWIEELEAATDPEAFDWIARTGGTAVNRTHSYHAWLSRIHRILQPEVYWEIGVDAGETLALAKPPTLAIGVDPHPRIDREFDAETIIYAMTSDRFALMPHVPSPDLAFIDGLHLFEQTLRDFINIERDSHEGTVILLHDVLPAEEAWTTRNVPTHGTVWTGDVWKIIPILRKYRPDLLLQIIPAAPSGLAVVMHPNPDSRILNDRYDEIIDAWYEAKWNPNEKYEGLITDDPEVLMA